MAESITSCSEDKSYVNIHGNDVRVLICAKTNRILIPIDELRDMGFSIYRKSQYNKLLVEDSEFNTEFNHYMLQCAQTYMLKHKVTFKENDIIESINNCKKLLSGSPKETSNNINASSGFLQRHVVKDKSNDDITITSPFKQPAPMTVQNLNTFNERKVTANSRRSSTSSSEGGRRSKNFRSNENESNGIAELRRPRNSFDQKNQEQRGVQNTKREVRRPPLNHSSSPASNNAKLEVKPLNSITLDNTVHQVIVTCVEETSSNIIWAQSVENGDTLEEIDEKIKEDLKNASVVTRCEYNQIYIAQDQGAWFRCKVIKFRPLTISFVDYGNCAQVTERDLRKISTQLAEIPAQAVKIILQDHYKPDLYEAITIKITNKKDRGTYFATVVNENPEPSSHSEEIREAPVEVIHFNKIPLQCTLQSGQKVMIIGEASGTLAVRTKESYEKLKQIEETLKNEEFTDLSGIPKKNQVVVLLQDGQLKRAEVLGIDGAKAIVTLLDYHKQLKVDCSQLKNITESLFKEPMTYLMTPPLKDYEVGNQKMVAYVQQLVASHAKPIVSFDKDEFDLTIDGALLSAKLRSVKDRVMLNELQEYRPHIGSGTYMLYACHGVDNVTLVSSEEVEKYVDHVIKTDLQDDDESYVPILGEVCLGSYQGSWSRCVAQKVLKDGFEVRFIDFGNLEVLKSSQLKRLTPDGTTAPVLGVPCRFTGYPQIKNIDELLIQSIEDGECYNLVIKRYDGSCYEIEAPEIYNNLK